MDKNIKSKKPWYKRTWMWFLIVVVLIVTGSAANKSSTNTTPVQQSPSTAKDDSKQEAAKWDVEASYAKVDNGMTKAQVEMAVGKKSESCTENTSEYIGKTEICNYGGFGDSGMITVTYSNDKVSSKTKSKF